MPRRSHLTSPRRRMHLAMAVVVAALSCTPSHAQPAAPAAYSVSGAERDRMYEELHRDVAAMERELGIYKRVAALVAPSVVHVEATPLAEYRLARDIEEAGSGLVVQAGGRDYILTNRHVIKHSDVDHIRLELSDGRQMSPKKVLSDKDTDVAVLVVEAPGLVPAKIGDSDSVEIGEIVMAFGSPFNLRQSVSHGIVSAKGRSNLDLDDGGVLYQNFMQTDAAINPGNSGGPLVNLRGEVIGLNTAIASESGGNHGVGFSIPINVAMGIMQQLVETGRVEYGFLGVTLDGYFDARAAQLAGLPRLTGTRVKRVTARSPSEFAGVRSDDIILRFNGIPIENDQHLISLVKLSQIGRQVELEILRDREVITVRASIGRQGDYSDASAQDRR